MAPIFIAYRENDAKAYAVAIRDVLSSAFGDDAVFLDKDALSEGQWAPQLEAAIAGCRAFVLVLGRRWVEARASDGRRRLNDASDVHRQEVALALSSPDVTVIPLLVDGATLPAADLLPEDLRGLATHQALLWSDQARHRVIDQSRLVSAVERVTGRAARRPTSPRGSWLPPALLAIFITLGVAAASSIGSVPMGGSELVIVLGLSLLGSYGARALWHRLRSHP